MPSNQTPHLGLSQWEADDEILRADFNADNAKIDAAVAELAGAALGSRQVLLLSDSVTNPGTIMRIPLDEIDLTPYSRLVFCPSARTVGYSGVHAYINNSRSENNFLTVTVGGTSGARNHFLQFTSLGSTMDYSYNRVDIDLTGPRLFFRAINGLITLASDYSTIAKSEFGSLFAMARYTAPSGLRELDFQCSADMVSCSYSLWGVK